MSLREVKRKLAAIRRALAPRLPPPAAPSGPPRVTLFMPANGTGPGSATGGDPGAYSSRLGDIELIVFDPAHPRPSAGEAGENARGNTSGASADNGAPTTPAIS